MGISAITEGRGAEIMRSIPRPYDPHGFDAAMMTAEEFTEATNRKGTWHDDHCYDSTLKSMNEYNRGKNEYPHLLRTLTIKGLKFEFRLKAEPLTYKDPDVALAAKARTHEFTIRVFNEDDQIVASAQDEWGCMLLMTAREYRSFGIGSILLKLAYDLEPGKPTGGTTNRGYRAVQRYHRDCVRQALETGLYKRLVKARSMTVERVKEIVNSAMLSKRPIRHKENLSSNNPDDWLLLGSPYGSFILYDKKLKTAINDELDEFFLEKFIKGMVYISIDDDYARIKIFGGVSPTVKTLMLRVAITWARLNKVQLWVEPHDLISLPSDAQIGAESLKPGYRACPVTGALMDIRQSIAEEAQFRKSFDRFREFESRLYELAEGQFRIEPAEEMRA